MRPHTTALPDGFAIGDDRRLIDMEVVHRALAEAYWATRRRRDLTERSFAHSLAFGVRAPDGATVGFGRVVTDYTLRAHLADIVILPAVRGRGLGRALVGAMLGHPELVTVTRWTLTTADAHGLYAGFGFRASAGDPDWMVLARDATATTGPLTDERESLSG